MFYGGDAGIDRKSAEFRFFGLHELLRREGLVQNHKRAGRIYQEENLSLRTRYRVKRPDIDNCRSVGSFKPGATYNSFPDITHLNRQ